MTNADERPEPPTAGTEVETLTGFLRYYRQTLLVKAGGLSRGQLQQRLEPSTMTLGGMVKHLACVEDYWFGVVLLGNAPSEPWASADWDADEDWDWTSAAEDGPEQLSGVFDAAVRRSDSILEAALASGGLDRWSVKTSRNGRPFSLRWILVHLVEEYARHCGHADLIRESIDGQTGD